MSAFIAGIAALSAAPVLAYGPYTSGTTGYDYSYQNCKEEQPPSGQTQSFAVIGVTGGRPFSLNSCAGKEFQAAPSPSLYFNTGYSGAYGHQITSACAGVTGGFTGKTAQAYRIGCSEADYAIVHEPGSTAMWWLDVETGNSWSSSSLALNRATIQGAVDRAGSGAEVGIYSTAAMWTTITGGSWAPSGDAGDWVANGTCSTDFTGVAKTVWLYQYSATYTAKGATVTYDGDYAC